MIDIEKAISDVEKKMGRELTAKEKSTLNLFGGFMSAVWSCDNSICNTGKENEHEPLKFHWPLDALCVSRAQASAEFCSLASNGARQHPHPENRAARSPSPQQPSEGDPEAPRIQVSLNNKGEN